LRALPRLHTGSVSAQNSIVKGATISSRDCVRARPHEST
jgi:hypothetical protein